MDPKTKTIRQISGSFYFKSCPVLLLLFCTKTNKCTIISQIITLLHYRVILRQLVINTLQGIDHKLSEDDTIVSKHVAV
jgi:hypothetical protein